jgi:hypothetical protein
MFRLTAPSWLKTTRPRGPRPARARFLPRLESLEDRTVPSTLPVGNDFDSGPGSLRQAVLDANANPDADTIVFAKSVHQITLTSGELAVTGDLTIQGPAANKLTVSGNHASRVFHVSGGVTVTIAGLTIADGKAAAGGGILNEAGASLTVADCTLNNNEANDPGFAVGGAIEDAQATLSITNCSFNHNRVSAGYAAGGAIDIEQGSDTSISNCSFTQNEAVGSGVGGASGGGAINVFGNFDNTGAAKTRIGGGIAIEFGSTLTLTDSTLSHNLALGGAGGSGAPGGPGIGGGIDVGEDKVYPSTVVHSTAAVTNTTLSHNQALGGDGGSGAAGGDGIGGGISVGSGALFPVHDPLLTEPLHDHSSLTLSGSTLDHNEAGGGQGGAGGSGGNAAATAWAAVWRSWVSWLIPISRAPPPSPAPRSPTTWLAVAAVPMAATAWAGVRMSPAARASVSPRARSATTRPTAARGSRAAATARAWAEASTASGRSSSTRSPSSRRTTPPPATTTSSLERPVRPLRPTLLPGDPRSLFRPVPRVRFGLNCFIALDEEVNHVAFRVPPVGA